MATKGYSTLMLHLLWSIIVGFIVGLIASAIMHTHMGFIGTTILGIIGSVVGGLIARLFSRPHEGSSFHPAGFIMSIVGAIVVVFLVRLVGGLAVEKVIVLELELDLAPRDNGERMLRRVRGSRSTPQGWLLVERKDRGRVRGRLRFRNEGD